jgi:tetratricopeptide (TPR) repeat protein
MERDWQRAEDEIVRVIQLKPDLTLAHSVYCFYLSMLGRTQEAHREGRIAERLEPPDSARVASIAAAWPYMAERQYDLAIEQLQRVLELDRNFSWGHLFLGTCYQAQSNYVQAIETFRLSDWLSMPDEHKEQMNKRLKERYEALRQAFDTRGDRGYWETWIELMNAEADFPWSEEFYGPDLAACYAMLGEKEKALEVMHERFGEPNYWQRLKFDPLYEPLRDEPGFKELMKKAGLAR